MIDMKLTRESDVRVHAGSRVHAEGSVDIQGRLVVSAKQVWVHNVDVQARQVIDDQSGLHCR